MFWMQSGSIFSFVLILDFTLEGLDQIHRIYEAEESFEIIQLLVSGKLYLTLFVSQGLDRNNYSAYYTWLFFSSTKGKLNLRKTMYFIVSLLVLIGVYSMRWNVVIGGQLFSKSFAGFTSFKVGLIGLDGTMMAAFWLDYFHSGSLHFFYGYCHHGKWWKKRNSLFLQNHSSGLRVFCFRIFPN